MAKQLLPNGSVVTLKGATKKLMTIGIEVEMEGDEKTYDLILSILVDTFISKISLTMQPGPKIDSISGA